MIVFDSNLNKNSFRIEDAGKALNLKKNPTPNYRYVVHRLLGLSKDAYNDMEYDLSETARIIDTESIVATTFRKKRQLILQNGFQLTSAKQKNLDYINKRLEEIEYVTSQSFTSLVSEIAENLVNFNNCFLLKHRKEDTSSGLVRVDGNKELKPIAGLYTLASPTIDTAADKKTGIIKRYRHRITLDYCREFDPRDIYHIHYNKRVGITIGTPPLEAVKDDILLLRSIEQDAEALIHRHSNPFMLVRVGTDTNPARILGDGTSEIDVYSSLINNMDESGGAAVPHKVDVRYIGAESQALRLESYLSYFRNRVLSGLATSEVDLGSAEGVGGSSADIVTDSMKSDVKAYQSVIEDYISNQILCELLLESPMYKNAQYIPTQERVFLEFLNSDTDKQIKMESHYLLLYQSGLITKEAAIRGMSFDEDDINNDPNHPSNGGPTNTNSNNNSVKSTISNQILNPKNQHNISDALRIEKPFNSYYSNSYSDFYNNLTDVFPEDIVSDNTNYIISLYERVGSMLKNYGIRYVDNYIEKCMFKLLEG